MLYDEHYMNHVNENQDYELDESTEDHQIASHDPLVITALTNLLNPPLSNNAPLSGRETSE
ncbi:hypothetical protein DVS77_21650 [Mycolicibacterium moriokaense]|nr:hypothetical protein DVS77_21650 [Mycolicibacterium moriokaense]